LPFSANHPAASRLSEKRLPSAFFGKPAASSRAAAFFGSNWVLNVSGVKNSLLGE
jgi:hypothetical protein